MSDSQSAPKHGDWGVFRIRNDNAYQAGIWLNGEYFTLYYDYDETRDGKLWTTDDDTRIRWFRERVEGVLLRPLSRLLDPQSCAFKSLNSEHSGQIHYDYSTFTVAAFSVLLNSIDALGFLVPEQKPDGGYIEPWHVRNTSGPRFKNFVASRMSAWDTKIVPPTLVTKDCENVLMDNGCEMKKILWTAFRSSYTHMFRSIGVGYDIYLGTDRWRFVNGILQVNPTMFFEDFHKAVTSLFDELESGDSPTFRAFFLRQFRELYPRRTS